MRRLITTIAVGISTFWGMGLDAFDYVAETRFGVGYRHDDFKWSIAGPDHVPNVLSELTWTDLQSWQIDGQVKFITEHGIYLRANGDYGKIGHGKNRDSDYLLNNKEGEYSRSENNAGRGEVFDIEGGAGYQFILCDSRLWIAPLIGYSLHEQHLQIYDGHQVINLEDPALVGHFHGLHSNYRARWHGTWIGADLGYQFNCNIDFIAALEYHWAHYKGRGHWNLREEFRNDFLQTGHGHGFVASVGGNYRICENWKLGVLFGYQNWKVHNGKDKTFFIVENANSGLSKFDLSTRLNEVKWHSFTVAGTITWVF